MAWTSSLFLSPRVSAMNIAIAIAIDPGTNGTGITD